MEATSGSYQAWKPGSPQSSRTQSSGHITHAPYSTGYLPYHAPALHCPHTPVCMLSPHSVTQLTLLLAHSFVAHSLVRTLASFSCLQPVVFRMSWLSDWFIIHVYELCMYSLNGQQACVHHRLPCLLWTGLCMIFMFAAKAASVHTAPALFCLTIPEGLLHHIVSSTIGQMAVGRHLPCSLSFHQCKPDQDSSGGGVSGHAYAAILQAPKKMSSVAFMLHSLQCAAAVLHCAMPMAWSTASITAIICVIHVLCILQALCVARPLHYTSCPWRLQPDRTTAWHAVRDCGQFSQCSQNGLVQWQRPLRQVCTAVGTVPMLSNLALHQTVKI